VLQLDPTHPAFVALATEVFQQAAAAHFARQPLPDPQYTTAQAAELLGTTAETICDYLRLPAGHPRRLPYVAITDALSGRRILLSDLTAWQQRNRHDEVPVLMQVSRTPGRRRRQAA
jgi:hypothetical protein